MSAAKFVSSFRLASLLRHEKDPSAAFKLFRNPNPETANPERPFRYSLLCYDIIITKLGRAKMFDELQHVLYQLKSDTRIAPTEVIFCNVIDFYARGRLPNHALQLFDDMPLYRCQRTVKSVNSLLNALLKCRQFEKMSDILLGMEKFGNPDACTYNILINGCFRNGCCDDAWRLFDEMLRNKVKPSGVTFGTLIHGLCRDSKVKEALKMKHDMLKMYGVRPTIHVYASLIKALCEIGELSLAFKLKEEANEGKIKLDSAIYSTLISSLLKVGRSNEVSGLLEEMRENLCKPDTVTYNVLINGFCIKSDTESACRVLDEMEEKGCKPDVISFNMVLAALCKAKKLTEASYLFEDMPRRGCGPDVVSYRVVFDGLCDGMQSKEAASILDEMLFKGYKPRRDGLERFLKGLCQNGNLEILGKVMGSLHQRDAIDAEIWSIIIDTAFKELKICHMSDSIDLLLTR
ncbi:PREDICTED: putative pentatricopeptide repeat-containing protein At1g53330 [Tarenaya hassleriana]|uniref:putative pentatricopeptide repeat-containing protein At1g53330 n=1 Tax=Tarenaya hassleriana TaxID=28532 RepID=UPI00053C8E24|nr:PREDICTED: putative pentatricopeptide repeat-containing protein At1g53330 [Tarenaya hassleriana]